MQVWGSKNDLGELKEKRTRFGGSPDTEQSEDLVMMWRHCGTKFLWPRLGRGGEGWNWGARDNVAPVHVSCHVSMDSHQHLNTSAAH